MPSLQSRVLDLGLNVLDTETTHLYVCSQEPATYTEASSTYALGNKNFGAGGAFGAPANGTPNGRKVDSTAVADGTVTATGTAAAIAFTDNTNSRLHGSTTLASSQGVTSGNTWTLPTFAVRIPSA